MSKYNYDYNPHTASEYSKHCMKCNHKRRDKYAGCYMEDLDKCALSGKYIEFDENDYPIGCLLRYVGKKKGE